MPSTLLTAKDVMTRDVESVAPEATLHEVAERFAARHIGGAPVVDPATGELVGIITEADLLNEDKRRAAIPRQALFGFMLVSEERWRSAYDEGFALRARDVMTRDVFTAAEDTPLAELADQMVRRRINRIPIVRGDSLVGMVTRGDLVQGLRAGLPAPSAETDPS